MAAGGGGGRETSCGRGRALLREVEMEEEEDPIDECRLRPDTGINRQKWREFRARQYNKIK
jgi:hypothetical protein